MKHALTLGLAIATATGAFARSPERDVIPLSITWDVGLGNNVYVTGNHPDIGSWNAPSAIKLRYTTGNVWTGQVAVQKGTALEYKFIARNGASNQYCNGANVTWEAGANRTTNLPSAATAPYAGKSVFYYSSWSNVVLITATGGSYSLSAVGPGRTSGEVLHRADGVGEEGEALEFVLKGMLNGVESFDKPPTGEGWSAFNNYYTTLDALLVQDGQIFNYWPSNSVSAPRYEDRWVDSSFPPISGRTVRIWLPRGYDSHPWKRYPVIYMQDGQNMADPANPGGTGSWQFDATAAREARQGRMREIILVGIDNYPERRRWEYNPLGDQYPGEQPGRADAYLAFLVNNVRPTIDAHYRTLNDLRNTFVGGSSMGGIFSIYAGFETNVFGGVLAMSPAVTRAPNYRDFALPFKTKKPLRIYMDTGTSEGQIGTLPGGYYWDDPWSAYDSFLKAGYAPPEDLMMRIGCGQGHNEAAWRARLPDAVRFLLNVRDDPNLLAQRRHPPVITSLSPNGVLSFPTQEQFAYRLQQAPSVTGDWTSVAYHPPEDRPWDSGSMTNPPAGPSGFLRVVAEPSP